MSEKLKVVSIDGKDFLTVAQVASTLEISRQRVHQILLDGRFDGAFKDETPRGDVWYIPYPIKIGLPSKQRTTINVQ